MKRYFLVGLFIFCLYQLVIAPVQAQDNFRSGETITLAETKTIDSDYFAAGERIIIEGTINGDAYLAAGDITINGTITGDVLAAAGNITINGPVNGSIRVATGNLTITDQVGRNLTAFAGNISLSSDSNLSGSAVLGAGNISLQGPIDKGVVAGAETLSVRDRIGGDLIYWSDNPVSLADTATVSGTITHRQPPQHQADASTIPASAPLKFFTTWTILSFLTALAIGWLLIAIVPVYMRRLTNTLKERPLASLGIGFLALTATPFIALLLVMTVIGVPLTLIWIFAVGVGIYLSQLIAALALGDWLKAQFKLNWNPYFLFALGLLLYRLVILIPILGWIIGLAISLMGFGSLILFKRQFYLELRQKKLI